MNTRSYTCYAPPVIKNLDIFSGGITGVTSGMQKIIFFFDFKLPGLEKKMKKKFLGLFSGGDITGVTSGKLVKHINAFGHS